MPKASSKLCREGPSSSGLEIVASQSQGLTDEEKQQLIQDIARWPKDATHILHSWTRREILHLLCAEMGRERKYTGMSKSRIIEQLVKVVSQKAKNQHEEVKSVMPLQSVTPNLNEVFSRQRKSSLPRIPVTTLALSTPDSNSSEFSKICKNLACKAILRQDDSFCKRCSCYICHKFDDNKDPSLWLVCNSEPPYHGFSCGLSAHVECLLKEKKSQICRESWSVNGDGTYCCASCGKVNGLLGCWKKQLSIAKEARRVDVLCYRVYLSHRLFSAAMHYTDLLDLLATAVKKLEEEMGPLREVSASTARGIVSRLSTGFEVQKLCEIALEKAENLLPKPAGPKNVIRLREKNDLVVTAHPRIQFEYVSATSLCVILNETASKSSEDVSGYKLWHRKVEEASYAEQPTLVMLKPGRYLISDLQPLTEYTFKVASFTLKTDIDLNFDSCIDHDDAKGYTNTEAGKVIEELPMPNTPSPIGLQDEAQHNHGASSRKVRDLGKILQAAFAQENGPGKESSDACELESGSNFETKNSQGIINPGRTAESEDRHGDSMSALDEERATNETATMNNSSHGTAESQKDSTNSSNDNQASGLPQRGHENLSKVSNLYEANNDNECTKPNQNDLKMVPFNLSKPVVPISMCKVDTPVLGASKAGRRKPVGNAREKKTKRGKELSIVEPEEGGSKKRQLSRPSDVPDCSKSPSTDFQLIAENLTGSPEKDYECCVKVVRKLECEGYIQKDFRLKFLTWFSLKATSEEKKIVGVFVKTMLDDPASLAGQLVDTFSDGVCSKRASVLRNGFCSKLWH